MTEFDRILLMASITILGGVVVLVAGQIIIRFFLEPLQDFRKTRARVINDLVMWGHVYSNPLSSDRREVSLLLRERAAELRIVTSSLPCYWLFSLLRVVPSKRKISTASDSLFFISYSLRIGENIDKNIDQSKEAYLALGASEASSMPMWQD